MQNLFIDKQLDKKKLAYSLIFNHWNFLEFRSKNDSRTRS